MNSINMKQLLPSLGYFGSSDFDCLKIGINEPIDGLKIFLPGFDKAVLNLRGIKLISEGKLVPFSLDEMVIAQSSTYEDDTKHGPTSLFALAGIHSKAEMNPFWAVEFKTRIFIDEVRLYNRADIWGKRSWPLEVHTKSANAWTKVYAADNFQPVYAALSELFRLTEQKIGIREFIHTFCGETKSDPLSEINSRGDFFSRNIDWRHILQFVDINSESEFSDSEINIVAAKLLDQALKGGYCDISNCLIFSKKLQSTDQLFRLQTRINQLSATKNMGEFVLSRHGLNRSILRSRKQDFLTLIKDVVNILETNGYPCMLSYGTLLGACRDGEFIAHDDDVDLLYQSPVSSTEEAISKTEQLKQLFISRGYGIDSNLPNELNIHVIDKKIGTSVDVFPCWNTDGLTTLHMERMALRSIPSDIFFPSSEINLYGETFPAPNKPTEFLRERYGEDWSTPNQFFEWYWKLI
jgi:hypothetical protein